MGGAAPARVRLYVEDTLGTGREVSLNPEQPHDATNVMRLGLGDELALLDGGDGEGRARLVGARWGRGWTPAVDADTRRQELGPDLGLLFAPVKHARPDFIAGMATELGVSLLWPVISRRTAVARANVERLRANAIAAAGQSKRRPVPRGLEAAPLEVVPADWPAERRIMLCDEAGAGVPVAEVLGTAPSAPRAVLVGIEGGVTPTELDALRALPGVTPVAPGSRVLTVETAALSAL